MGENKKIDLREIDEPEFVASQIMVGRSMLNLLDYIFQNYQSHFKDVVIDDIENIDIVLLNQNNSSLEVQTVSDHSSFIPNSERTKKLP